jgi:hypothetical protein
MEKIRTFIPTFKQLTSATLAYYNEEYQSSIDEVIAVDSASSPSGYIIVHLPEDNLVNESSVTVYDIYGNCGSSNIKVRSIYKNIVGSTYNISEEYYEYIINKNNSTVNFIYDDEKNQWVPLHNDGLTEGLTSTLVYDTTSTSNGPNEYYDWDSLITKANSLTGDVTILLRSDVSLTGDIDLKKKIKIIGDKPGHNGIIPDPGYSDSFLTPNLRTLSTESYGIYNPYYFENVIILNNNLSTSINYCVRFNSGTEFDLTLKNSSFMSDIQSWVDENGSSAPNFGKSQRFIEIESGIIINLYLYQGSLIGGSSAFY